MGVVAPPVPGGAYYQANGHVGQEEGIEGRRLHSPSVSGRLHLYIPAQLASSNRRWYTSWFYLRNNDGGLPPYTGRIVESCPERWKYGVPKDDQPKLQPLLEGLARL